ncbi:hypothetical protein E2C01_086471 [Portunus trituberculatus]|uniref:Uncharacterized protein n=1 Tax=Portunus trituberculatus TaxID=210409 RepID=A0A5B7JGF1_PORTR|nr:hypothetical protein [Portunus trituberculatus]
MDKIARYPFPQGTELAPLQVLAHRGYGVGIPVLRMFHISVFRALIDYAAPVLFQHSPTQLKPLEYIQNESERVILGCPKTAKLEVLRAELDLPTMVCRIHEITCCALCRMACNGASQPLHFLAHRIGPPHHRLSNTGNHLPCTVSDGM